MSFWEKATWAEEVEQDSGGFEPLPEGVYTGVITDCTQRDTKSGTGKYINCKIEITGPTHKGRVVFEKLNILNPNDDAVRIGIATIHKICKAVGSEDYYDKLKACNSWPAAEKHLAEIWGAIGNRPLQMKLAIKKDEKYGDQNVIKQWQEVEDNIPVFDAPDAKSKGKPF